MRISSVRLPYFSSNRLLPEHLFSVFLGGGDQIFGVLLIRFHPRKALLPPVDTHLFDFAPQLPILELCFAPGVQGVQGAIDHGANAINLATPCSEQLVDLRHVNHVRLVVCSLQTVGVFTQRGEAIVIPGRSGGRRRGGECRRGLDTRWRLRLHRRGEGRSYGDA